MDNTTSKIYGTTIYIGQLELETVFGSFRAMTYQDLITKGYIIALVHGSLEAQELYTRFHSSCVTSETMRSMDCDCVIQLEGAFERIALQGNGIIFYLIQEGRGCGYVGKSRACMMGQYYGQQNINTFKAYQKLGMISDYRDYRNVKDICEMLRIMQTPFVLMTNNPDKIDGFKKLGLNLKKILSIEFPPNPFNAKYLLSKQKYGHLLFETKSKISHFKIPYKPIEPFQPYALPKIGRFVHVSSYYLPIKPIQNQIYMSQQQFKDTMKLLSMQQKQQLNIQQIGQRYLVKLKQSNLIQKYSNLLAIPYWFKVNVFYDIASFQDYIVLTHNFQINQKVNDVPIVRIHSESLLNRFPLKKKEYKKRYKEALRAIVRRGKGLIIILYNDGRGSGLGHVILDRLKIPHGIEEDTRDFHAACLLLKHFVRNKKIQLICGQTSYASLKPIISDHRIKVIKYHIIDKDIQSSLQLNTQDNGFQSILLRMKGLHDYLLKVKSIMENTKFDIPFKAYVTGIGSSQAHARFCNYLIPTIKFITITALTQLLEKGIAQTYPIIIFSQGLSPNIQLLLNLIQDKSKLYIVTSVNQAYGNEQRVQRYLQLKKSKANFICYQKQVVDDTLIRIQGPVAGFIICLFFKSYQEGIKISFKPRFIKPSQTLVRLFVQVRSICFIVPSDMIDLCLNIRNKFIEGAFSNQPVICDSISFSHGYFQYCLNKKLPVVIVGESQYSLQNLLNASQLFYQTLQSTGSMTIIQLELFVNELIYPYMMHYMVDQKNWPGKQKQNIMYQLKRKESEI